MASVISLLLSLAIYVHLHVCGWFQSQHDMFHICLLWTLHSTGQEASYGISSFWFFGRVQINPEWFLVVWYMIQGVFVFPRV